MERATTSLEDMLARHPDRAVGYAVLDGEPRRMPLRPIYARPAGGICASVAEMTAWLRFHLDPVTGRDGLRLSQAAATELTAPQIYIGPSDFAEIGRVNYGFGFFVGDYRGARSIDHNGGPWCGYNCDLRLLPEHGSGVLVLTNGHDPGFAPLTNTALDHLLGLEPLPWLERFRGARAGRREHASKERAVRVEARRPATSPSHTLADYAGEYAHPAYGTVRITRDGDALRWAGLGLDLPMIHRHHDVFETVERLPWFGNWSVQFATGVESLAVPLEPAVAPIIFRRLP
jgi:CubicO group peptidase (beta-lactamase class C family)